MVESTRDNQDTMAVVELECSIPTCTLGPGETRWRAPALEIRCAVQVRNLHIQYNNWVELEKFHQMMEFNQKQSIIDMKSSTASIVDKTPEGGLFMRGVVGSIDKQSSKTNIINEELEGNLFMKETVIGDSDNDVYSMIVNTTEWVPGI